MATRRTTDDVAEETKVIDVNDPAYWEEKVPFYPPYDRLHKEDFTISVNGEMIQISPKLVHESGQPIMIKRKFYEVWRQSEAQAMIAEEYEEQHADK